MKTCLLLGRKPMIVQGLIDQIQIEGIQLLGGTNLADVQGIFSKTAIHGVIMGAGIALDDRLEIIRYIFETSKSTTVHMKDWDSGPTGMVPFVEGVLKGVLA